MSLSELVHCEYCNEVFTDKGLTRHQQIKHPLETPTYYKNREQQPSETTTPNSNGGADNTGN